MSLVDLNCLAEIVIYSIIVQPNEVSTFFTRVQNVFKRHFMGKPGIIRVMCKVHSGTSPQFVCIITCT